MGLEQKIEAVLFYENEPVEIKRLCKILDSDQKAVKGALASLAKNLEGRGICLINNGDKVSLATSLETQNLIENLEKERMSREIGKAGLETLAIILYNGPVSRREIDFVRGVNSTYVLRSLSMRGLIERELKEEGEKSYKYKASLPLLAHLGIKSLDELPEFVNLNRKLTDIAAGEPPDEIRE